MVPVFRPQTAGIAGVTGQRVSSGKRRARKGIKSEVRICCWLLIFRRGVAGKREETRLFRANESSYKSQEGRRGRPNQLSRAYRCRAGRLERIRPYLNGSLSLFPLLLSPILPPSKHTHTSYHTITSFLPAYMISRECVAIFSRIKTTYM